MHRISALFFALLLTSIVSQAQTGITIGPPRVYYTIGPGQSQVERVTITNPSKDFPLELAVSLEDWQYGEYGENLLEASGTLSTSLAEWVTIPESFFSLQPGESKDLDILVSVPAAGDLDSIPVRTSMLFVTQLNPRDGVDDEGANIRISVRTGIKLYQRFPGSFEPLVEITNFRYLKDEAATQLSLHFDNTSNVWTDGVISVELLNQETGHKTSLPPVAFYSMPGDKRTQLIQLPADLAQASYIATAIVDYGDRQAVKIAELEFTHERTNSEN